MLAHAIAALLLLLSGALVYLPLLLPGQAPYSNYSDIPTFQLGLKQVLYDGLTHGHLPLWHTDQLLGGPALTQPQALYLHPLQLLFWLLPPAQAFGPTFFLEFWVGALGSYAFARSLRSSWLAGLCAGAAQLVCFKLILSCFAGWSTPMATFVMLPWIAAAFVHVARSPNLASGLGLTCALAVSLAGGSPQTIYYLFLLMLGLPLVQASTPARALGVTGVVRAALPSYALVAAALTLALLCTAYVWLPVAADLSELTRARQDYVFFLSGHALTPKHGLMLFSPEILGNPLDGTYPAIELWEDSPYFGILPWLALLTLSARPRWLDRGQRYLLGAFWAGLLLSLETPLLHWAHAWLPGYAVFRLPSRMLFVTAVLGGGLFALAVDVLFGWLRARSRRAHAPAVGAVLLAILGEGMFHARAYLTTVPVARLLPDRDHPVRKLGGHRERVAVFRRGALNYGWATALGVELVNGYDPYAFRHVADYLQLTADGAVTERAPGNWFDLNRLTHPRLLGELSVGHVISRQPIASPELELVAHHDRVRDYALYKGERWIQLYVYRLPGTLPRARWAHRVRVADSERAVVEGLLTTGGDGTAWVLREAAANSAPPPAPEEYVRELSRSGDEIALEALNREHRLLVLAETFHPGWEVRVDGAQVPVFRANLALLAARVPPGHHRIDVRFVPTHFVLGQSLSIGALALVLGGLLYVALRRRCCPPRTSP